MWWKDSTAFWVSNNLGIIRLHTLPLKDGNSVVWQREVQTKVTLYMQKMNWKCWFLQNVMEVFSAFYLFIRKFLLDWEADEWYCLMCRSSLKADLNTRQNLFVLYSLTCHQPTFPFPFCNKGLGCVDLCTAHVACKWVSVFHLASKIWLRGWTGLGISTWHCSLAAIPQLLVLEPWKISWWWKRNSSARRKK